MIVQLRLDERLIHGQITTAWSRFLDVAGIVVASDKLAADKLASQVLLMAAPAGKKVAVKSISDAITLLQNPKGENMRMLVIVDNPQDALTLAETLSIKEINVANYVKKKSPNKVSLTRGCNADAEDLATFKKLVELDAHVFSQLIPSQPVTDFTKIVRETTMPAE
jgi:mannose/fructose/N-acetylgalactosamine-specific phosphotransferase system component IIB